MLVTIEGRPCPVTAPRQRAVLAALAIQPGVPRSADQLLHELWGDDVPSQGTKAVAFQVSKLRKLLEPDASIRSRVIETTAAGYVLNLGRHEVDLFAFDELVDDARAALTDDPSKAHLLTEDALALWRGRPFADVSDAPIFSEEARRLERRYLLAQQTDLEALLAMGEHVNIVASATQLLEQNPLEESLAALLMRALQRSGRTADALRVFGDLRRSLLVDLGIDPSPALCELESELLSHTDESGPTALSRSALPSQPVLPSPTTSLIGREGDIGALHELLADDDCRIVTLLGPGGVGKTRLALEAADQWTKRVDQSAVFVALASVRPGEGLTSAVANALGLVIDLHIVGNGLDERTQLFDFLSLQSQVVLLDNFEHLVEEADFVADLAARCPNVKVLVTSQVRLGVAGEWVVPVEGLSCDTSEALELFVTRSRQVGSQFDVLENGAEIERICRLVDGLPLGIELAAASTVVLPLTEIAGQLEANAASLELDLRDIPERHRSLQAAFDHSWRLLDQGSRDALGKLAVFAAPFTKEAAQQVADASLPVLMRLLSRSLLRRTDATRFDLHPMIQRFALERLGDSACVYRDAHARYYLDLVSQQHDSLQGGGHQFETARAVTRDLDNIRAATLWAADADSHSHQLVQALHALNPYYFIVSLQDWTTNFSALAERLRASADFDADACEAYQWARVYHSYPDAMTGDFDNVIARMTAALPYWESVGGTGLAWCLMNLGVAYDEHGSFDEALNYYERAASIAWESDQLLMTAIASWHGWALSQTGRHDEARAVWETGLASALEGENQLGKAYLIGKLGLAADESGDHELAMQCHVESQEVFEIMGDHGGLGYAFSRMSWTHRELGDFEASREAALKGLAHFRAVNHRWGIGASFGRLGHAELTAGRIDKAAESFSRCVSWGVDSEMASIVWYGLAGVGLCVEAAGRDYEAAVLLHHNAGIHQNPYVSVLTTPALDRLRTQLSDAEMAAAESEGTALSMDEAVALALDISTAMAR